MINKPVIKHGTPALKPAGFMSALALAFLFSAVLYSQPESGAKLKEKAVEAFSKGDFEKALDDFGQLLKVFPADPLYKYYYGVSLVRLDRDPVMASSLLSQAMEEASGIKSVPADGWFYLGRARQMSGEYDEAIRSFNAFTDVAGRRKARKLDTEAYIKQCRNREGMRSFEQLMTEGAGPAAGDRGAGREPAVVRSEAPVVAQRRLGPREYLPEEDDRLLSDAFDRQARADSLQKIVSDSKAEPVQRTAGVVSAVDTGVFEARKDAAIRQQEVDNIFSGQERKSRDVSDVKNTVVTTDSGKSVVLPPAVPEDSQAQQKQSESLVEQGGSTSLFRIIPGRIFQPDEVIEMNPGVPPGLVYRIQMAVFRNPVSPSLFGGISPVYGIKADGTDITYYYAGYFRRSSDAQRALTLVRKEGLRDAFVVSVMDGKPVSQERAAVLEREWGNVSFAMREEQKIVPRIVPPREDNPPELSFRVEITRSEKPLKEEVVEGYRALAGKRGFEILNSDDAREVYLIGKFITFESAEDYAGLLRRNGYSDARVSAWLGKREIPVDTAKQLFEMTE